MEKAGGVQVIAPGDGQVTQVVQPPIRHAVEVAIVEHMDYGLRQIRHGQTDLKPTRGRCDHLKVARDDGAPVGRCEGRHEVALTRRLTRAHRDRTRQHADDVAESSDPSSAARLT